MEKIFSPEKVAHTQKERTLSDAELLKGGAEYKLDEKGENIMLEATEEQKDKAKEEMESDLKKREEEKLNSVREKFENTLRKEEENIIKDKFKSIKEEISLLEKEYESINYEEPKGIMNNIIDELKLNISIKKRVERFRKKEMSRKIMLEIIRKKHELHQMNAKEMSRAMGLLDRLGEVRLVEPIKNPQEFTRRRKSLFKKS